MVSCGKLGSLDLQARFLLCGSSSDYMVFGVVEAEYEEDHFASESCLEGDFDSSSTFFPLQISFSSCAKHRHTFLNHCTLLISLKKFRPYLLQLIQPFHRH